MEFKKERNFIAVYNDGIKVGAWNITDGCFIGKSGKVVKNIPNCFTYSNLPELYEHITNENILASAIRKYRDWSSRYNINRFYNDARGNRFEQLISVGLIAENLTDLDSTVALTKELVNYIKEHNDSIFNTHSVESFLWEKKYSKFLSDKPLWAKQIFKQLVDSLPNDYLQSIINRAVREHLDSFFHDYYMTAEIENVIKKYYDINMSLYGAVEVKPNILSNYAHLLYLEKEYKDAHYDENIKAHNDKPWLYFEDEIFFVRPLLSRQEFHEEGERQNNCVERIYMEYIYYKRTHVVVVRRKEEPDKNYITCEVTNDGNIIQYLKKNNNPNVEIDARIFRSLYQKHLSAANKMNP